MLDSLRRIGRTWFGKVIGAFLIVGLAGFGISNVIFDFGSSTVAKVGEDDISTRDFQRAYNEDLERIAQQIGQFPAPADAVALGIPNQTIGRLASEAAMNRMAVDMGVGVSDARLSQMLRQDPSFAGTLGTFDRDNFARVLRQNGMTESEYFELQRRAARRQQIGSGFFADSAVPQAAEELLARFTGDTRTIDYFVINEQGILPVAEPTDEELAAYLAEHQAEFRTEETRTADLLVLSLATLAATKEITDEEIAAEYERTKANRVRIEKRTVHQVPLTEEQAAAFEAGKAEGKLFDTLVTEAGLTATDMGSLAKAEILDPTLAEAVFSLQPGQFAIIPGVGGKRAVTFTAIEPGGEITLEEARDEIAADLANKAARDEYIEILDQIEELRAAFRPLPEIAERFGLELNEVTLTANGAELANLPAVAEENRGRVAQAVFEAEQGDLAPTVAISANNNIWFDLKAVEPARDQTLDEVRDQVVAAITAQRTADAVTAEVETAVERMRAGETLADVAVSLNQFPQPSQPLTRSGDGTPVIDQNVANAVFNGGPGHFGSAINGDGDHVVFQVVDIIPAEPGSVAEARPYLEETTRQSLFSDFIAGLRETAGVRVNEQTLNQLLALDATGQ